MKQQITTLNKLQNESKYRQYLTSQNDSKLFFKFPCGYAASIIFNKNSYGYEENKVELALFKKDTTGKYDIHYTNGGYFDDVCGYLTFTEAEVLIDRIYNAMFYYPTNNLEKKIVKSKVLIGNYPYTVVFTPTALHHTCSNVHKRKITITAIPDTLSLLNILTLEMEKIYLDIEVTDTYQPLPTKVNMVLASIRVEADKAINHYCNTVGREFESPYINTTLYQKDKFSTFMENITTINRSYFIALLKAPMGFTSVGGYAPSLLLHVSLDIKTNRGIPATSYIAGLNLEYGLGNKRVLIYMGCTDNRFNFHSIRTITRLTRMPIDIGIEITLDKIEKLEYCLNN